MKAEGRRQKAERSNGSRRFLPSAFCLLPSPSALPRDISNLPRSERVQKLEHAIDLELRIARLDDEKEAVARGLLETLHVEDRVIRHRQSVEREHAEHRAERREQDRALERDRDPRR